MQMSHDRVTEITTGPKVSRWDKAGLFGLIFVAFFAMGGPASADDLKGTVVNGTTRRPSSGDEVVLLSLSKDGMSESAHEKADSRGHFRLPITDPQAMHVVRVIHQGVTYHTIAKPSLKSVDVQVYDAAEEVNGVTAVMDVERFEASGNVLEVKQLVTMRNASKPPRTLMNDRPFELHLPPEAQIQSGLVQTADGQPLKQKPLSGDQKGQYYFLFPLRPGDTRFAVVYRLPYSGEAVIEPTIRNPQERFVIMVPKAMKFEPQAADMFQPMPGTTLDNVQGSAPIKPGQLMAFRISGRGTLEELRGRRTEAQDIEKTEPPSPGGGLGSPIDAPDPLHEYRWPILVGLTMLLGIGATWVMSRASRLQVNGRASALTAQEMMIRRSPDQGTRISMSRQQRRARPTTNSAKKG